MLGVLARADAHRLLEQRDARLLPQRLAEQQRRVPRHRQHRCRGDHGGVVGPHRLRGGHLQMHLEGRGRSLEHHVLVLGMQPRAVRAVDVQPRRSAVALAQHLLVQRAVAQRLGQVGHVQFGIAQAGQDADGHHAQAHRGSDRAAVGPGIVQSRRQPAQARAAHRLRRHVDLDVEAGDLGDHVGRRAARDELRIAGCGATLGIHQPGLQLQPGHRLVLRQLVTLDQVVQPGGLGAQCALEAHEVAVLEACCARPTGPCPGFHRQRSRTPLSWVKAGAPGN